MNETQLKQKLRDELKERFPHAVVFLHQDKFTAGIPDISFTWNKKTVWIEVKHVTEKKPFRVTELQELTIKRLDNAGYAFILIFDDVIDAIKIIRNGEVLYLHGCIKQVCDFMEEKYVEG